MSYAVSGIGVWSYIADAALRATNAGIEAGAGKYKKAERAARNVEQAARVGLEAAQAAARGAQQAAQVTAEGQVAAAAARIEAQRQAREKRNKMILYGSGAFLAITALVIGGVAIAGKR